MVIRKRENLILGIIQLFVALGALPAGYLFFIEPDGSKMGMTLSVLEGSPFRDFLIPGIFLFTVNGVFNLISSFLSFFGYRYSFAAGIILGLSLIVWVSVQVYSIGLTHFLQPAYFIIGIAEIIVSILLYRSSQKKSDN